MPSKKLSNIVLNAAGTAVTGGDAADATVMDHIKQAIPLVKDDTVAIVGSDTTRTVTELGMAGVMLVAGEKLRPVSRVKSALGMDQ